MMDGHVRWVFRAVRTCDLRSCWLLALLLVLAQGAVGAARAASEQGPVRVFMHASGPTPVDREDVLAGRLDERFAEVDPQRIRLGPPGRVFWIRVEVDVPAATGLDLREGQWLLALNRVELDSIEVLLPDAPGRFSSRSESFFTPGAQAPALGSGFFFRLPRTDADSLRFYVRLVTEARLTLKVTVLREGDALARDRALSNLFTAVYTALLVLLVINLILYAALREVTYLAFVAWGAAIILMILGANGHLYGIPGLRWLGWWGPLGGVAFTLLACSASLWLFRAFAECGRVLPRLDRGIRWAGWLLLVLALVSLLNIRTWVGTLQNVSLLALALTALGLTATSARVWRAGGTMGRVFFWIWSLLALLLLLRAAMGLGLIRGDALSQYGYQVGLAVAAFLFSVALAERVIEFRQQRDRARLLKEQVDATLRVEQARRTFVEGVRSTLAASTEGDAEWVVLRRLLVDLVPLIPQQCSAVVVQGSDGMDFMFSEPAGEKAHFARLLKARVDALRGICRSRAPMVVKLDEPGDGDAAARDSTYAVVPLPLQRSGWGALLLERAAWEEFTPEELKLAQEFARLGLDTAQDMLSQAHLQREAESDPLTGALNRRAGDAALEAALRQAMQQRLPLALLFVDIDHFKAINDMHGHAVGDQCLTHLAEVMAAELDSGDVLSRHGGEEFQIVLPGRTPAQARELAERVRKAVVGTRVVCNGLKLTLTVSIGVAQRQADDDGILSLQERADKALYKAKANGRNCVATLAPTDFGSFGGPGVF